MLRLLLATMIVLIPNSLRFFFDAGIPGFNLTNLLFILLLLGLALGKRESAPTQHGYMTPPLLALLLVITTGFIVVQLVDPGDFADDATKLKNAAFYPCLYFVYRHSRQDLKATRQLIHLTLAVAVAAGVEAIYQWTQFGMGSFSPDNRASGPFGGILAANRAGIYYALFLPMLLSLFLRAQNHFFWRFAALAGSAILCVGIMATFSRQGYVIAAITVIALLFRKNVLLTIVLSAIMVSAISLLPGSVAQRVTETQQSSASGEMGVDDSTASRYHIWTGAMKMVADYPAGVGPNRFRRHIGDYSSFPDMDAHNSFVLALAEYGPLGLGVLVWLFVRLFGLAKRLRHESAPDNTEAKALADGLTFAAVALLLGSMFSSLVLDGSFAGSFWIMCGLVERLAMLQRQATELGTNPRTAHALPADQFPLLAKIRPGYRRSVS